MEFAGKRGISGGKITGFAEDETISTEYAYNGTEYESELYRPVTQGETGVLIVKNFSEKYQNQRAAEAALFVSETDLHKSKLF